MLLAQVISDEIYENMAFEEGAFTPLANLTTEVASWLMNPLPPAPLIADWCFRTGPYPDYGGARQAVHGTRLAHWLDFDPRQVGLGLGLGLGLDLGLG